MPLTAYEEQILQPLFRKLNSDNSSNRRAAASELANIQISPAGKLAVLEMLLLVLIDEFDVDTFGAITNSIIKLQDMHAAPTLYTLGYRASMPYAEIAGNAALKVMSARYDLSGFTYVVEKGLKARDESQHNFQADMERRQAIQAVANSDISTLLEFLNSNSHSKTAMAAGALARAEYEIGGKIYDVRLVNPLLTCLFDAPINKYVLKALKKYRVEQAISDLIWVFKFYWPVNEVIAYEGIEVLTEIGLPIVQPITQAIQEMNLHIERLKNIDNRWSKSTQYLKNEYRPMFPAISQLSGAVDLLNFAVKNIK